MSNGKFVSVNEVSAGRYLLHSAHYLLYRSRLGSTSIAIIFYTYIYIGEAGTAGGRFQVSMFRSMANNNKKS